MKVPDYLNGARPTSETRANSVDHGSRSERAANAGKPPADVEGAESAQYSRAPEIVELTSRLHELPEVRQEVVARVARQMQAGGYLTRETAEKVAESLMEDLN